MYPIFEDIPPDFDSLPFHEVKYHLPLEVIYVKSIS